MKPYFTAAVVAAFMTLTGGAVAATFPGYGYDTGGPGLDITLNPNGTATATATGESATYDGSDDTYIGVINNSGHTVYSLALTSASDIFGFDGDGLDYYGAPTNMLDSGGYGGPDGYFTNITTSYSPSFSETGTVNFIGGIKSGGTDYFALENALTAASFSGGGGSIAVSGAPEPGTWALMLVGVGCLGGMIRTTRRKAIQPAIAG